MLTSTVVFLIKNISPEDPLPSLPLSFTNLLLFAPRAFTVHCMHAYCILLQSGARDVNEMWSSSLTWAKNGEKITR